MPMMKVCCYAGCRKTVPQGERYCSDHKSKAAEQRAKRLVERSREYDRQRGSSADRGYGYAWRKARAAYLMRHPLCVACLNLGISTPATDVDHIIPHRGNKDIFWNSENWQALCHRCHTEKTNREDGGMMGRARRQYPLSNQG